MNADRRLALRAGALVLLLQRPLLAFGAEIVAVRVWPAADYTRVTLESDSALTVRHSLATGPDRLVIDIDGLELSPQLREIVGKSYKNVLTIAMRGDTGVIPVAAWGGAMFASRHLTRTDE